MLAFLTKWISAEKTITSSAGKISVTLLLFVVVWCERFELTSSSRLRECMSTECLLNDNNTDKKIPAACEPKNLRRNIATLADVVISPENATCGVPSVLFCSLKNRVSCLKCDNNSHLPRNMVDGDRWTWWQSKPWPGIPGRTFEVNVTINLPKTFQLIDDIVIDFHDGLPQKMIVDKSSDFGKTWQPMQYYADNCFGQHQVQAMDFESPGADGNLAVKPICTEEYSINYIWEDKSTMKVHVAPRIQLLQKKGLNDTTMCTALSDRSSDLSKFLLITNLRLRLQRPPRVQMDLLDERLRQRSEHYGIRKIYIPARCYCNGHGGQCDFSDKSATCICQHNTEGRDCEKCKVLYWMKPWEPGYYSATSNFGNVNQCTSFRELDGERLYLSNDSPGFLSVDDPQKRLNCNCNGHSQRCENVINYGTMCVDCRHNTIGRNCQNCRQQYYRDVRRKRDHPHVCIACKCDSIGSSGKWCQPKGQCRCRRNFVGKRCDKCKVGWTVKDGVCVRVIPECVTAKKQCDRIDVTKLSPAGRYQCIWIAEKWCACVEQIKCTVPMGFLNAKQFTGNSGSPITRTNFDLRFTIFVFFIMFFCDKSYTQ